MRIGMVLDTQYPDRRVEKEVRSLTRAGHEVHLLCMDFKGNAPADEWHNRFHIHRIGIPSFIRNKLKALVNVVPLYDRWLGEYIEWFGKQNRIEAIHTHDLWLVGAGLRARRKLDIPLIADLHEQYVETLKYYDWSSKGLGRLLVSIERWQRTERRWLETVDRVIVVVDETKDEYVKMGIDPDKIAIVPNYVDIHAFLSVQERLVGYPPGFILQYIGLFAPNRGLDIAIKAVDIARHYIPEIYLCLVGDGSTRQELEDLTHKLGLESYVHFAGWKPYNLMPSYIRQSDICLLPIVNRGPQQAMAPHKLFQYMAVGKPIIASDCAGQKRIIEDAGCGVVIPSGSVEWLVQAILELYDDPVWREVMGENGRSTAYQKYNWGESEKVLLKLYEGL